MTLDYTIETPVYQQIAAILRDRIARGVYTPGHAMPSEAALRDEFGVAQLTVRKAVRTLAREGLVRTIPQRGSYVIGPVEEGAQEGRGALSRVARISGQAVTIALLLVLSAGLALTCALLHTPALHAHGARSAYEAGIDHAEQELGVVRLPA